MEIRGIRSATFRMSRGRCYLYMLMFQAPWLGWTLLAVVAALMVAGFIISPWLGIAALGFGAFLAVMVMSFVIMVYGFNSITGINMTPHSLISGDQGVRVEFEDGDGMLVPATSTGSYHVFPGGVLVPVTGVRAGWLWVPLKAFETDREFQDFLKNIYKNESNTEQEQELLLHARDGGEGL